MSVIAALVAALVAGCDDRPAPADVPAADVATDKGAAIDVGAVDAPADAPDVPVTDAAPDAPDASSDVADVPAVDVPPADAGRVVPDGALADVQLADLPVAVADCSVPVAEREAQETRCDGVDNDCDGRVDLLLPTGPNACATAAMGVCASGWAACAGGERRCYAPSPSPEVSDGLDNDCDGAADNGRPATVRPRALVLAPRYLWTKGGDEIRALASVLDQWGIPYDLPEPGSDWVAPLRSLLGRYSLVLVPGYLDGAVVDTVARLYLEEFAGAGGVVLLHKPVSASAETNVMRLAGLRRSTRRTDVTTLRVEGTPVAALRAFDTPEERELVVTSDVAGHPIEVFSLEPDPDARTAVAMRAYAGATDAGPAFTRRPVGSGAVYTLGHDLHSWSHYRCYVNCFEPAGDVLGMLLRDATREGAAGHVVLKHTVPGAEEALLLSTHDIDATESSRPGPWGASGTSQVASLLFRRGAVGSFFFTTNYPAAAWDPATVRDICALGMCPAGGHSVHHFPSPATQAVGDCTERFPDYRPATEAAATLCGEVGVSLALTGEAAGVPALAWRSPYLDVHPRLYDLLSDRGVIVDSSFAVGDFKTNLPLDLARTFHRQDLFHRRAITEVPVTLDDGFGARDTGGTVRTELQGHNLPTFVSAWASVVLRNGANNAHTTLLVHPSFGVGLGPENLAAKVASVDRIVAVAQAAGLRTDVTVTALAEFWRARREVQVDASFDSTSGYRGTITAGDRAVTGFALEFGDVIRSFECAGCGPTRVSGRRVVLTGTLAAGRRVEFTALPR